MAKIELFDICPIWQTPAKEISTLGDNIQFFSPRAGGNFILSRTAASAVSSHDKVKLSTFILEENLVGNYPKLSSSDLEKIDKNASLTVVEKYNLFLKATRSLAPNFYDSIMELGSPSINEFGPLLASIGSASENHNGTSELIPFRKHAIEQGLINSERGMVISLTLSGFEYLENLGQTLSDSDQIFVAMWFGDPRLNELYSAVIQPAVINAGYKPIRIDDTEHNEKIDDQIIAEIRKSKAIIVDITCGLAQPEGWSESEKVGAPRGGVFYEAGFAKGLGLPVIWMVDNDIAEVENVGHFDTRQFNQIRWTTDFVDAKKRLQSRIEATLGRGAS